MRAAAQRQARVSCLRVRGEYGTCGDGCCSERTEAIVADRWLQECPSEAPVKPLRNRTCHVGFHPLTVRAIHYGAFSMSVESARHREALPSRRGSGAVAPLRLLLL